MTRVDLYRGIHKAVRHLLFATCERTARTDFSDAHASAETAADVPHLTRRNVAENPYVTIVFHDPITMRAWRLVGRFVRAETSGPLFEAMSVRIDVPRAQRARPHPVAPTPRVP